jgi:deazaflavin-dependent oxidoreductase (nitroreductase family)
MFLIHRGFRRDLERFVAGAELTPIGDRRTWARMARRWELFVSILHKHHHGEDAGLWPLLHRRATSTADQEKLDKMTAQHARIDAVLADCSDLFLLMLEQPGEGTRDRLHGSLTQARRQLLEHLACEERDAKAMVQRLLSPMEREHFVPAYAGRDRLTLVGWLCEGLSEEQILRLPGAKHSHLPIARFFGRRFAKAEARTFRRVLSPGTLTRSDRRTLRTLRATAKIHLFLRHISGGRWANRFRGMNLIKLTVTGRRSGKQYTTPLVALRDGDDFIVAASSAGVDREPFWWLNLKSDPHGEVELAGQRTQVFAAELEGAERELWWSSLVDTLPDYANYQAAVSRRIAVIRISPS